MSSTLNNVIIFASGVIVGALVTWKFIKNKYEQIARDEIDSVKEVYSRRYEETKESVEAVKDEKIEKDVQDVKEMQEYEQLTLNYTEYHKGAEDNEIKPYVITPEEFGDKDDYEIVSLTYWADEVLTDDMDYPITNVDELVGRESLTHFGQYEDDSVFVRNDKLKKDYEILLDTREYSMVFSVNPREAED